MSGTQLEPERSLFDRIADGFTDEVDAANEILGGESVFGLVDAFQKIADIPASRIPADGGTVVIKTGEAGALDIAAERIGLVWDAADPAQAKLAAPSTTLRQGTTLAFDVEREGAVLSVWATDNFPVDIQILDREDGALAKEVAKREREEKEREAKEAGSDPLGVKGAFEAFFDAQKTIIVGVAVIVVVIGALIWTGKVKLPSPPVVPS